MDGIVKQQQEISRSAYLLACVYFGASENWTVGFAENEKNKKKI